MEIVFTGDRRTLTHVREGSKTEYLKVQLVQRPYQSHRGKRERESPKRIKHNHTTLVTGNGSCVF